MLTLLEEVMEEAQASMQQFVDDRAAQAESANMHKLAVFLIGDCYEVMASEKIANLEAMRNA